MAVVWSIFSRSICFSIYCQQVHHHLLPGGSLSPTARWSSITHYQMVFHHLTPGGLPDNKILIIKHKAYAISKAAGGTHASHTSLTHPKGGVPPRWSKKVEGKRVGGSWRVQWEMDGEGEGEDTLGCGWKTEKWVYEKWMMEEGEKRGKNIKEENGVTYKKAKKEGNSLKGDEKLRGKRDMVTGRGGRGMHRNKTTANGKGEQNCYYTITQHPTHTFNRGSLARKLYHRKQKLCQERGSQLPVIEIQRIFDWLATWKEIITKGDWSHTPRLTDWLEGASPLHTRESIPHFLTNEERRQRSNKGFHQLFQRLRQRYKTQQQTENPGGHARASSTFQ